jgi:hypothetical protein
MPTNIASGCSDKRIVPESICTCQLLRSEALPAGRAREYHPCACPFPFPSWWLDSFKTYRLNLEVGPQLIMGNEEPIQGGNAIDKVKLDRVPDIISLGLQGLVSGLLFERLQARKREHFLRGGRYQGNR